MYFALKHIHLTTIAISVLLLLFRFALTIKQSPMLQKKWLKILPHVNDSILLASAIALCFTIAQYPFVTPWLTEKVLGLILYIGLGLVALKIAKTNLVRFAAMAGALGTLVFMAKLAVFKQPFLLS